MDFFTSRKNTLGRPCVFKKQRLKLSQISVSNFVSVMTRASTNKSESRCMIIPFSFHKVWHEIFAEVYFCGLAVFCVLRELIFAIRTDWFF